MLPSGYLDGSLLYRDYIDAAVYLLSVISAVIMISWRISRRRHFIVRWALCAGALLIFICGVTYPIQLATLDGEFANYLIWFHTAKYFVVFIFSDIAVKICCDCDWWAALFCASTGYCIQHINARVGAIIQDVLLTNADWTLKLCVSLLINAAVYLIFYIFVLRRSPEKVVVRVSQRWQIALAAFVVGVSICYNSFGISYAYNIILYCRTNGIESFVGYEILIFNYVMSLIIAFLILALEFTALSNKELSLERNMLKQLLAEKRAQYESEKRNIELINIKCHDIKHQLNSLRGVVYDEQLKELREAVNIYDDSAETGCDALDVVLRQKKLLCNKSGIRLTCMVDGSKLDFVPEHELYSLFTNVIDNAVDGVKDLPEEKRVISITQSMEGGEYVIATENFFGGALNFSDGLPSTTKRGEGHGYGMKSMRMIVEKNGGRFSVNTYKDVFVVRFAFPLSVAERNNKIKQ